VESSDATYVYAIGYAGVTVSDLKDLATPIAKVSLPAATGSSGPWYEGGPVSVGGGFVGGGSSGSGVGTGFGGTATNPVAVAPPPPSTGAAPTTEPGTVRPVGARDAGAVSAQDAGVDIVQDAG
jgi:hypothetical protein